MEERRVSYVKPVRTLVSACMLAGLLSVSATAGSKFTGNGSVVITPSSSGGGIVTGYLGHIYNGPGKVEFLRCQRGRWTTQEQPFVNCWARNERGEEATCTSFSSHLAKSITSISSDSKVTFRYNAAGDCTSITVVQSSEFQDKR
jgi:hypothetical protein